MASGRIVGGTMILLVGLGLTACSSPQLVEKMRAHQIALAKTTSATPIQPDRRKPVAARPPAVIPEAMKPAAKADIPRAAGNDTRPAKPTIRF